MRTTVNINPKMLYWAIARAGRTVDELTEKLPKLPLWLKNEVEPTVKQLEEFSKRVHLPFGYLFLSEPPIEKIPFPFFRKGNSAPVNNVSLNIYDTILTVQQRQQWLTEYLKSENSRPLGFVGKYNIEASVQSIVDDMYNVLDLQYGWTQNFKTKETALQHFIEKTEEAGIIVVVNGIVGNNTRRLIDVEECRGFVIVNEIAPFLFINNSDAVAGKMFTLAHELAHVWLGASVGFDTNNFIPAEDQIELLCDAVAAEFLVPGNLFEEKWRETQDFSRLASYFKVSQIVIARRALTFGEITHQDFFNWYNTWKHLIANKAKGGGDFYNNQPNRVSLRFAGFVERAVLKGALSYREAYRLTGLNGDTYHNFVKNKLS